MGSQILLSGASIKILADAVASVGEKSSIHVALVEKFSRFMTVIYGQHKSAGHPPSDVFDPPASRNSALGLLPRPQSDVLPREEF